MNIKVGTVLKVADNSGAAVIKCIKIYGGSNVQSASVGDLILASVKKTFSGSKIKRKTMVKCIIVRVKANLLRRDGTTVNFKENSAVTVDNNFDPIGKRIAGPIAKEVKEKGFLKISSLTKEII